MQIVVASGKGGTGKTTVAVSLFHFWSKYNNKTVHLLDCDVEEPNAALFLSPLGTLDKKTFTNIFRKLIRRFVNSAKNVLNGANLMPLR